LFVMRKIQISLELQTPPTRDEEWFHSKLIDRTTGRVRHLLEGAEDERRVGHSLAHGRAHLLLLCGRMVVGGDDGEQRERQGGDEGVIVRDEVRRGRKDLCSRVRAAEAVGDRRCAKAACRNRTSACICGAQLHSLCTHERSQFS
jgi:hypothetical protein